MAFDCVAIGDQIASSVGTTLQCEIRGGGNLTTSRIIDVAGSNNVYHKYCIISAGTYDYSTDQYQNNINSVRNQSVCKFYVWILPNDLDKSRIVTDVAQQNGDIIIAYVSGPDHIVPANVDAIVGAIRQATGN